MQADCEILASAGRTAFNMPLLHGDLAAHLQRVGPVPWGQVRDLALRIGAALRELHARGIAFGGLKPSNVFLFGDDTAPHEIRLLDVGNRRHDPKAARAAHLCSEQVPTGEFDARSAPRGPDRPPVVVGTPARSPAQTPRSPTPEARTAPLFACP